MHALIGAGDRGGKTGYERDMRTTISIYIRISMQISSIGWRTVEQQLHDGGKGTHSALFRSTARRAPGSLELGFFYAFALF